MHYYSSITGLTMSGSVAISSSMHIMSEQHSIQQIIHPQNSTMATIIINIVSLDISSYNILVSLVYFYNIFCENLLVKGYKYNNMLLLLWKKKIVSNK